MQHFWPQVLQTGALLVSAYLATAPLSRSVKHRGAAAALASVKWDPGELESLEYTEIEIKVFKQHLRVSGTIKLQSIQPLNAVSWEIIFLMQD